MNITRVLANVGGLVGLSMAIICSAEPPPAPPTPPAPPAAPAPAAPAVPLKEAAEPTVVIVKEATELLAKAKAAAIAAKDVSATTESSVKSNGKGEARKGSFVVAFKGDSSDIGAWRLEVEPTKPGAAKMVSAFDGTTLRTVNDKRKEVTESPSEGGPNGAEGLLLPMWFTDQREDGMASMNPKIIEQVIESTDQKIGDEKVTVVRQVRTFPLPARGQGAGGSVTDTLHVSLASDNLPRRVERTIDIKNGENVRKQEFLQTFANLKVNTSPSTDTFAIKAPEGYKTRQLDPNAPNLTVGDGEDALDFALKDADGKEHKLADFKGKVVLLDFWATWCPPCRAAMPELQKLHEEFKDKGLVVIGMDSSEKNDTDGPEYMKKNGFTYLGLYKADDLSNEYGISSIPTMILLDKTGKLVHVTIGFDPKEMTELKKLVEEKLK